MPEQHQFRERELIIKPGSIRDFRRLWISGLPASLGSQMSSIALPLLVLRHTGSPVEAAAVGTVSVGALLVGMLPGAHRPTPSNGVGSCASVTWAAGRPSGA